jgi:hypothetical protein
MNETTTTTYPFPDGEDDLLKQKFNIDLREYSTEQKDAAATAWVDFCRNQVDSSMFIKLIALCDGSLTEATVLWDLLKFHRNTINKLKDWKEQSAQNYVEKYGADFGIVRSYQRALNELTDAGLIIQLPKTGAVIKKFRLDWIEFSEQLSKANTKLPALSPMIAVKA